MGTSSQMTHNVPSRDIIQSPHNNGACTHLTMTRLYTDTFRCQGCLKLGSMGWVYKCTQDQELILEDLIEKHDFSYEHKKLDVLADLFERQTSPKKRSPEARASKLSFLEEISDADLKGYTRDQLNTILCQRAHLLDTIAAQHGDNGPEDRGQVDVPGLQIILPSSSSPPANHSTSSPSWTPPKPLTKPWLPQKDCQFKCCHACRATCLERSWLSLNAIVNGELPATAIMGYGFHLRVGKHKRPVALNEHVKNIGLRPHPHPRPRTAQSAKTASEDGHIPISSTLAREGFHDSNDSFSATYQPEPQGVQNDPLETCVEDGAVQEKAQENAPASAIPQRAHPSSLHGKTESVLFSGTFPIQPSIPIPATSSRSVPLYISTPQSGTPINTNLAGEQPLYQRKNSIGNESDCGYEEQKISQQVQSLSPTRRDSFDQYEPSSLEQRPLPPLPTELPGHAVPMLVPSSPTPPASLSQHAVPTFSTTVPCGPPSSSPAEDQLSSGRSTGPATPMEADEWLGYFSSEPLEVKNGVAITEEALELHVPDVLIGSCETISMSDSGIRR
ncbi:hypothetical protein BP5796_00495 [Coleophoma crateriformis]|uniref:Uncharacterized protein n=1 Tax=Coleophoma crateriformis TaxID=565419 RepID=A0A3D8T809_9HELO|nr:hypothetical protein BP5796_00495 [Coleophoma crateriformis]